MNRWILAGLLAVAVVCTNACGGRQAQLDNTGSAPADVQPVNGLPALAGLPAPKHGSSSLAPGFFDLDPLDTVRRANATDGAGSLTLDNSTLHASTWVVYGVYGFDGDNYPVSVKLNVGAGAGKFYLAFSNYAAGSWKISGPYNGDGEYGIPALDVNSSPSAYTSPNHTHYFAVIVPDGQKLELDAVSVGVSGGHNAPQPVFLLEGSGGATAFQLDWLDSPSVGDPDFAGYILERAPQFSGAFSAQAATLSLDHYFLDGSAVLETQYRYRVVTYDTSGNFATSQQIIAGPSGGLKANPVCKFKMPRGPLYGPASVDIDMSDSFDPEGEAITDYSLQYIGTRPTQLAGPQLSLTLQPGCYSMHFTVKTADARQGDTYAFLRVYPRWQPSSELLRATTPTGSYKDSRLYHMRGGLQPSDGKLTIAAMDYTLPGLSFWHYDGSQLNESRAAQIEDVVSIGDPLSIGNELVFPVSTKYAYYLAGFDGTNVNLQELAGATVASPIAAAQDSHGAVWICYTGLNGANHNFYIRRSDSAQTETNLATMGDDANCADMVFEPVSGHFFVFFEFGGGLNVEEWDPVTRQPVAGQALSLSGITGVDAEINPENGRVGVLYFANARQRYREQDGLGGWTLEQLVDDSTANENTMDLAPSGSGHLNAYFAYDGGQANRYVLSAGTWTKANTIKFASDSCYDCCLMKVAGSPDMRVADLCVDGEIRLARINDNNTDNNFASIDSASGQGFDMHAAAGLDGLHVIWNPALDGTTAEHMLSAAGPDEGSVWADKPAFPESGGLNLVNNVNGDVYATSFQFPNSNLLYWDPMAGLFINDASVNSQGAYRPLLGNMLFSPVIVFSAWDDNVPGLHYIGGYHGSYAADVPFDPGVSKVYDGVFTSYQPRLGYLMGSGTHAEAPDCSLYATDTASQYPLYTPLLDDRATGFNKQSCAGRCFAAGIYAGRDIFLQAINNDWLIADGPVFSPVRYDCSVAGPPTQFTYPIGGPSVELEGRRTVSVGQMPGLTCVNLVATIGGEESYFEWSNFGSWETLPLPPGLDNMSCPLIAAGSDGRWHIIYKDWKTDSIMCRSSL